MAKKITKKFFLAMALVVLAIFATTPAMAAATTPAATPASPSVPTAAPVEMVGIVVVDQNTVRIEAGHVVILSAKKELMVQTGLVDSAGNQVLKPTGLFLLRPASGQLFIKSGQFDGAGNPLFIPDGRVLINWQLVVCPKPALSANGNFAANALKAFALPDGSQFLLTPTGDPSIDSLVIAATNKYFGDIQNALNGSAQNIDPAVARALSEVVKNNAPAAIQIIRVVGVLAGLTDQQTAALIRLQKDPVIENYVNYNNQAKAAGYIVGRNTYNQQLVSEGAKSDKPIIGNIYVSIAGGKIKLSPGEGLVINPAFQPAIKADAAGKWYLEVRTLDNRTLHGELIGSFAGKTFTGTAWLSEMTDIIGPTIAARQAATFSFPNLSAPGVLKGAVGMTEFMAQAAGAPAASTATPVEKNGSYWKSQYQKEHGYAVNLKGKLKIQKSLDDLKEGQKYILIDGKLVWCGKNPLNKPEHLK